MGDPEAWNSVDYYGDSEGTNDAEWDDYITIGMKDKNRNKCRMPRPVISQDQYEQCAVSGKGGYAHRLNEITLVDCYEYAIQPVK